MTLDPWDQSISQSLRLTASGPKLRHLRHCLHLRNFPQQLFDAGGIL